MGDVMGDENEPVIQEQVMETRSKFFEDAAVLKGLPGWE